MTTSTTINSTRVKPAAEVRLRDPEAGKGRFRSPRRAIRHTSRFCLKRSAIRSPTCILQFDVIDSKNSRKHADYHKADQPAGEQDYNRLHEGHHPADRYLEFFFKVFRKREQARSGIALFFGYAQH